MASIRPRWRSRPAALIAVPVAAALMAVAGLTITATTTTAEWVTVAVTAAGPGAPGGAAPRSGAPGPVPTPTRELPPVPAAAYVVADAGTGEVLAASRADEPRPVASLTKLMTARLTLKAGRLDAAVTVPPLRLAEGESHAGLEPGDRVTRGALLDAMLVASAGDAARALALDVAGSEQRFVALMNAEAEAIDLPATRYANATGLDHPTQRSSAADVARLALELRRDPVFRRIVTARRTTIAGSTFPATNDLLGAYPGADGVKTGHTGDSGWCLAASATRDGRTILAVVLGAPTEQARDDAARTLLDHGFGRR